jgi:MoxR-like ATPase
MLPNERTGKKGVVVGGAKGLKKTGGSTKQLAQLYKLLEKLEMEILRMEEKELDLDGLADSNSYHIQEYKLKEKAIKVWKAICKIENRDSEETGRVSKRKFCYKGEWQSDFSNSC